MNVISMATTKEAAGIADFNIAMALETENKVLDRETIHAGVRQMLANQQLGFYLAAHIDGSLAGCLAITYEWSDWRNGLFWWIQSVYVPPEFRECGVFSDLYAHVKQLAGQQDNVCGIRLYAEKDNERAIRTYKRLGMDVTDYRILEEEWSPQRM